MIKTKKEIGIRTDLFFCLKLLNHKKLFSVLSIDNEYQIKVFYFRNGASWNTFSIT